MTEIVLRLQSMADELKQSVYFSSDDLRAIDEEIERQLKHVPQLEEIAKLEEQLAERQQLLERLGLKYDLVASCPELFEHFANGLIDMQEEIERLKANL